MTRLAVTVAALMAIEVTTASWTRRRIPAGLMLVVVGVLAGGAPSGSHIGGWAIAGLVTAAALVVAYITLLRFDLTMAVIAIAVMSAIRLAFAAASPPYPGAIVGLLSGVVLVTALAAGWFRALRQAPPAP